jgi:hypothetical protein
VTDKFQAKAQRLGVVKIEVHDMLAELRTKRLPSVRMCDCELDLRMTVTKQKHNIFYKRSYEGCTKDIMHTSIHFGDVAGTNCKNLVTDIHTPRLMRETSRYDMCDIAAVL